VPVDDACALTLIRYQPLGYFSALASNPTFKVISSVRKLKLTLQAKAPVEYIENVLPKYLTKTDAV
jgi:hypothetical protein